MLRTAVAAIAAVLFIVSIGWCIATWSAPGRFLPPSGDVGEGFRSHAGWLQWVQYAPWEAKPDYVAWSLPWFVVFLFEASVIVLALYRRRDHVDLYSNLRRNPK